MFVSSYFSLSLSLSVSSVSEEDQRLLDLWDQCLDCDVTSSSTQSQSQGAFNMLSLSL